MNVTITIPTMLAQLIGGDRKHGVDGETVAEAVGALLARYPELRVHLFAEDQSLRPHVRCFHNDTMVRDLTLEIGEGDTITLLQAVSGGA